MNDLRTFPSKTMSGWSSRRTGLTHTSEKLLTEIDYGSYHDVASKKDRSNENLDVALTKDVSNENFNNPRY